MSYIDENLLVGEYVLFRTKPHWIIFAVPIMLSVLAIVLIIQRTPIELLGYLLLFTAAVQWFTAYLTYATCEYGLTNKRILIKIGFIRRQSIETLLQRIEGIQIDQNILGRMLNYGTIIICGVGGTKDHFRMIDSPIQFRRNVQEQIERILQNTPEETELK
ncbi:PH domain-containing protein [soil metagenome]